MKLAVFTTRVGEVILEKTENAGSQGHRTLPNLVHIGSMVEGKEHVDRQRDGRISGRRNEYEGPYDRSLMRFICIYANM